MKLFLTSSGIKKEIKKDFLKFLGKDPKGLKVAFIPTAAYPKVNQGYVEIAKKELFDLGFEVEDVDLKDYQKDQLRVKLKDFDVIFVNGGNTFYLLDWVRKSGFDSVVKDLISQEKIYVGVSAGSILVGPDIAISGWHSDQNVVNLKDTSGLNIVPFVICPHFQNKERSVLERGAEKENYQILAITDEQAIFYDGSNYKVLGPKTIVIFN